MFWPSQSEFLFPFFSSMNTENVLILLFWKTIFLSPRRNSNSWPPSDQSLRRSNRRATEKLAGNFVRDSDISFLCSPSDVLKFHLSYLFTDFEFKIFHYLYSVFVWDRSQCLPLTLVGFIVIIIVPFISNPSPCTRLAIFLLSERVQVHEASKEIGD